MKIFIDESGDHNLDSTKLDNSYNVFVLGAVCFSEDNYQLLCERLNQIKQDLFGGKDYIIHTAEIVRPSNSTDPRTQLFNNIDFRNTFYSTIENIFDEINFEVIACCVKKSQHLERYGAYASDPYIFGFENILNRIMWRSKGEKCEIYPEKRSQAEDGLLEINYLKAKMSGTKFFTGSQVSARIETFKTIDKKANECGSQIADLVVSPIGRHFMGIKPRKPGNELKYQTVKRKIPNRCLTVFP
ncbi:MAG: DUF3800 domain-containing protein [Candidatus Pacebacteria bacterium]|nr:DUF3800 domain-containing protein [Candidatus Paceibacterota bacterium]